MEVGVVINFFGDIDIPQAKKQQDPLVEKLGQQEKVNIKR